MKRTITSTLIGFFVLMMILPIVTAVITVADVDPWFIVTHNGDLITNVLGTGNGGGFGQGHPGQEFNLTFFEPELWRGISVMSVYTVVLFLTGIMFANRRRME